MKNIIITGASGNLGEAVMAEFDTQDYFLNVVVRNDFSDSERIKVWKADLTNSESVSKLILEITATNQKIDAVVHLVGGYVPGNIADTTEFTLDQMIDLNFKSAFYLYQEIIPVFKKNKTGKFICIGAQAASNPKSANHHVGYALSKQLLQGFIQIINAGNDNDQISAHILLPSTLDTKSNRQQMPDADFSKWIPLKVLAQTIKDIVEGNEKQEILKID